MLHWRTMQTSFTVSVISFIAIFLTDGYEQGMMMENGLSPDYDDPAMYANDNSEYMTAAHFAQGG